MRRWVYEAGNLTREINNRLVPEDDQTKPQ